MAHRQEGQESEQSYSIDDALFCKEHWDEEEEEEEEEEGKDEEEEEEENDNSYLINDDKNGARIIVNPSLFLPPLLVLEQDLFWEDEELCSLFSKEHKQTHHLHDHPHSSSSSSTSSSYSNLLVSAHREAVEWILKVNSHYAFSALTAVLAVNYFDRFITSRPFQRDKPWMTQLVAVACLSLAAKVEETQVPLLLDLQVEESKYVFEAKTIQRMELLVLSTLHWKMNPVTPLSFIDHIIRRLGLKTNLHWEFMRRCELLLLSIIVDSRFSCYLPSVLATATMLHVIDQVEPFNPLEYKNQLTCVLKTNKDKVDECYGLIMESTTTWRGDSRKRKYRTTDELPDSPNGVMDASFSCDSSNDSWASSSSVTSSPKSMGKRSKAHENQQLCLPGAFSSVAVDVLTSPR